MSSEAVASVFTNLNRATATLINEIKAFLDSNQFTNVGNAQDHADIAVETAVYEVTDDSGVVWAGPDHRNTIITPYFSPHEQLHETIKVVVGLVFPENELSRCEEELRILGAGFQFNGMNFYSYLDQVVILLEDVRNAIPYAAISNGMAAHLLYSVVERAVRDIKTKAIDTEWKQILRAVNSVSEFTEHMKSTYGFIDKNLSIICDKIHINLKVDFNSDMDVPKTERESCVCTKLKSLGIELENLNTDGTFYNFLGSTSEENMLLLIQHLKQ
jgi:transcriptional regulator of NAD metabolism